MSSDKVPLVKQLFIRAMGLGILSVFASTTIYAVNSTTPQSYSFVIGMVDLVLGFTGIIMVFGKIEKSEKKKGFSFTISTPQDETVCDGDHQSIWDSAFDEGYQKCLEDEEENRMIDAFAVGEGKQPQ